MAFNKLSALALFAAYGPALLRAQALYSCDRYEQPEWDLCEQIVSEIDWTRGTLEGQEQVDPGLCAVFTKGESPGCKVSVCNQGSIPKPYNTFDGQANYVIIRSNCEKDKAGGLAPPDRDYYIEIRNIPINRLADFQTMTIAENEALNEEAHQLRVRQDPGEFTLLGLTQSVTTSERDRLAAAGSGTQQSWTTSEGYSVGISSTVEVGGSFFDLFSASVSLTVSSDYTESWSETLTFDPAGRCEPGQLAVLYMYPLFDKYVGIYANDPNTAVEWYVPVAPPLNTFIDVECLPNFAHRAFRA